MIKPNYHECSVPNYCESDGLNQSQTEVHCLALSRATDYRTVHSLLLISLEGDMVEGVRVFFFLLDFQKIHPKSD